MTSTSMIRGARCKSEEILTVSTLLNLLYKIAIELTFEKLFSTSTSMIARHLENQ